MAGDFFTDFWSHEYFGPASIALGALLFYNTYLLLENRYWIKRIDGIPEAIDEMEIIEFIYLKWQKRLLRFAELIHK